MSAGAPARRAVPLAVPCIGEDEERAVLEALRSGWLAPGPQIAVFERAFSELTGAPHVVAVNSCTAALHLALVDAGVRPGDEVVMSPITWASVGNLVANMGARPVFADVDPVTLNLDAACVERAMTDHTRAVIPVHMAGHPCDADAIHAATARRGAAVIEDAAHAFGARYRGRPVGTLGPYTCFSFYATKNVTTMEGGAVTLRDPARARHIRLLASNGMAVTAWDRAAGGGVAGPPEVVVPGFKYQMCNVGAAMGVVQLGKHARFQAVRRGIAALYGELLSGVDEIALPSEAPEVEHAWHLYIVRLRRERLTRTRDEIAHRLRQEGIGTGVHFHALHLHRYFREAFGTRPEDCPNATAASHEVLSLPLHPRMTGDDVHAVAEALKKVLAAAV